jgi:hypothetical protein
VVATRNVSTHRLAAEHALTIIGRGRAAGVRLKAIGGVGCWLHNVEHSERAELFARSYGDVDFVVPKKQAMSLGPIVEPLGYRPVTSFNSVQGETRLMWVHSSEPLSIDVFCGTFSMCHEVPIDKPAYLPDAHPSLALAELLLTKLQIVASNAKDLVDEASLLAFHSVDDIDGERFAGILARDWGLWRTVTGNLAALESWAEDAPAARTEIIGRARELRELAEAAPKSRRWKTRAVLGERVRWYEEPEEPEVQFDERVR